MRVQFSTNECESIRTALTHWADPGQRKERDKHKRRDEYKKQNKQKRRDVRLPVKEEEEEQEPPVIKSGACCHVLTCPSVVILGELRLFVDHHASDRHVRVLLFGLLYSLGQRLSPPTVNQHKQTKANKRFKGKTTQTDDGKHTCM